MRMFDLEQENTQLRKLSESGMDSLVYGSPKMAEIVQMLHRVAPMDVSVLLIGETGTGKEVLAQSVAQSFNRKAQPFVAINCASIPENLLESELFGHEKGAFTGAVKRTHGKFELANHGTLFLDEIGDMPLPLQSKLLRFFRSADWNASAAAKRYSVDVRLITATNQNLEKLMAEGNIRRRSLLPHQRRPD